MSIGGLARNLLRWSKNNSPAILTAIGAGGVISTAILAFRAGEESAFRDQNDRGHETALDKLKDDWPIYVPTVISGALTITAVVTAHTVSTRRQASVAAALVISEKTLYDYREKVAEIVSRRKSDQAMEEVVGDRIIDAGGSEVIKTSDDEQLCYDTYSGRFFKSNRQEIDWAVNRVNHQIIHDQYASVNDLYDRLGLDRTAAGDEMGWNGDELLDINFTSHLANGNTPCLAMDYRTRPKPYYYKS